MKAYGWMIIAAFALAGASRLADAAPAASCDERLTVEVGPAVRNPTDIAFLGSLLSNQPDYHLTLQQQDTDSVVVLNLAGPGPADQCRNAIETIRKDARVLSVRVDSETTEVVSMTVPVPQKKKSNLQLACTGVGSLYWAARHPAHAWRVLLPVQPGEEDTCP